MLNVCSELLTIMGNVGAMIMAFNDRIEAENKAEAERIEKEIAEIAERERIRKENERLKAEALKAILDYGGFVSIHTLPASKAGFPFGFPCAVYYLKRGYKGQTKIEMLNCAVS